MFNLFSIIINRILSLYLVFKYKLVDTSTGRPSNTMLVIMCVIAPIQEEILFRYAFYHLLEKYIEDHFYINIINGIAFGLIHVSNGLYPFRY